MATAKKSDLVVLRALLGCPAGMLSQSEKGAFQAMYDRVASGQQVSLSPKQRAWIDEVYAKHNLDKERKFVAGKVEVKDRRLLASNDFFKPTPLVKPPIKPPGRP